MATAPEVLEFDRSDPRTVVERLTGMARRADGEGWVNLGPALTDEQYDAVPHRSGLGAWFSGRGPAVPMATWTPPRGGARPRPAQVGVAHGTGPDALDRLEAHGLRLPPTWTKRQDHAKHGIVAELPTHPDLEVVVDWMLEAMTILSAVVSPDDRWIAEVHQPA